MNISKSILKNNISKVMLKNNRNNMDFDEFEKNIIFEYWKTLKRKNISNISYNNFIKKPYLENYIINLSIIIDNTCLLNNITN